MNFNQTAEQFDQEKKSFVNATEWHENWDEYWVVFADLIAFANRCILSPGITLNNIIRFHISINDAINGIEGIKKYQFTDACYFLTKDPKTALIIASNIQNECLLHNYSQIKNAPHPMFYHMIVPKVVISKGEVLSINEENHPPISRLAGISPNELLAGKGIVKAYYMERNTTGGLSSVDMEYISEIKNIASDSAKNKVSSLYKKWQNDKNNEYLSHDRVIDIPWLTLQPRQTRKGALTFEDTASFKEKLIAFNAIWRMNFTEHTAEGTPTDTLKQYGGAISHLSHILKGYTNSGNRAWDLVDITNNLNSM